MTTAVAVCILSLMFTINVASGQHPLMHLFAEGRFEGENLIDENSEIKINIAGQPEILNKKYKNINHEIEDTRDIYSTKDENKKSSADVLDENNDSQQRIVMEEHNKHSPKTEKEMTNYKLYRQMMVLEMLKENKIKFKDETMARNHPLLQGNIMENLYTEPNGNTDPHMDRPSSDTLKEMIKSHPLLQEHFIEDLYSNTEDGIYPLLSNEYKSKDIHFEHEGRYMRPKHPVSIAKGKHNADSLDNIQSLIHHRNIEDEKSSEEKKMQNLFFPSEFHMYNMLQKKDKLNK